MFKGILTAQITPFYNGKVDIEKFTQLIKRQKDSGINGIVIGGCTGESFTLEQEDCNLLWQEAIKFKSKDFNVIFGIAHNSTLRAIEMIKIANNYKPDGLLVITPFANKPSQSALVEYYNTIAEFSDSPIIVYNVPGRTAVSITAETVLKLSSNKKIVAIKQALSDFDEFTKFKLLLKDFNLLSGEDTLTFPALCIGWDGVICTSSNIIPELWVEMFSYYRKGDIEKAAGIHLKIFPLIKTLFIEGNPAPLKYAMKLMGLYNGELRAPLVEVSDTSKKQIEEQLKILKLI
ncbi:MAG: 4-hydroxy-tetrahydrodipicolinate synthase [Exilispira sp.]